MQWSLAPFPGADSHVEKELQGIEEYPRISWESLAHSRVNKYVFLKNGVVVDSYALQLLFKSPLNYQGGFLSTRSRCLSSGPQKREMG